MFQNVTYFSHLHGSIYPLFLQYVTESRDYRSSIINTTTSLAYLRWCLILVLCTLLPSVSFNKHNHFNYLFQRHPWLKWRPVKVGQRHKFNMLPIRTGLTQTPIKSHHFFLLRSRLKQDVSTKGPND